MAAYLEERARWIERPPIHVMVLGLRGIVDVQGGIETHARKLYPLLARLGCRVEVLQRAPYYPGARRKQWHSVTLRYLWSPRMSGLETAVHSVLGVLYAAVTRPDILHLHAVGPAFLAPFARLVGLRVVVTHHSADYRREKWGSLARFVLTAGEALGMRFANRSIVVSKVLEDMVRERYGVQSSLIPNGAPRVMRIASTRVLEELGLEPERYVLCVARLDKVKRQLDLIDAFESADLPDWKLVLVGALVEGDEYSGAVVQRCMRNSRVVAAGFRRGRDLRELFSHCGVFVLPSSLEGHPIALLEALSYGVRILASDLPENRALPIRAENLFAVGDVEALARLLLETASTSRPPPDRLSLADKEKYSWRRAAQSTRLVYEQVLAEDGRRNVSESSPGPRSV